MCVCQRINKLRNGSTLPIHKNFTRRDISVVHTKSSLGLFSFVVVVVVVFRLRRIRLDKGIEWNRECMLCISHVVDAYALRTFDIYAIHPLTHTRTLLFWIFMFEHISPLNATPSNRNVFQFSVWHHFFACLFFGFFISLLLFKQISSLWAAAFGNWKMLTYALNFPKTQRKCVIPIELIDMRVYLCVPYALRKGITHQSISLYVMSVVNVECALKVTHTRRVWMKPLKMVHNYNANTNI